MNYWEIIADKICAAGWSCVSICIFPSAYFNLIC